MEKDTPSWFGYIYLGPALFSCKAGGAADSVVFFAQTNTALYTLCESALSHAKDIN